MNKIQALYKHLIARTWVLGISDYSDNIIDPDYELKIRWIRNDNYPESWFADPFIVSEDDKIIKVLAEEFPYKLGKGRISRLIVDKLQMRIVDVKVILELSTHLSFPSIYRDNDNIYLYPENSASGHLYLYRYDENLETVSLVKPIIFKPLTDAIFYKISNKVYLLSTQCPRENKERLDIYEMPVNSFAEPKLYQKVYFNENIARNAGMPFEAKGKLIRPAQICNKSYGEGVLLQEVQIKDNNFRFVEIKRYFSPLKRYPLAFHTFNVYGNTVIFDAQGYRYRFIGFILERIGCFIKRLIGYNRRSHV